MNKKYAVSDLHGVKELWDQIINFLDPTDTLYCLGDCADRGPQGWEIIKEALVNSQVIYLKGNHEDMLVKAMQEYLKYETTGEDFYLLSINGGTNTFYSWIEKDGANSKWMNELNNLPTKIMYKNIHQEIIYLSHAGFTLDDHPTERDLIWSRDHFWDPWPDYEDARMQYCVHGHTPIILMSRYDPYIEIGTTWKDIDLANTNAFWYCDHHKCDIDCASFATSKTCLFDLDTFETIEFKIT